MLAHRRACSLRRPLLFFVRVLGRTLSEPWDKPFRELYSEGLEAVRDSGPSVPSERQNYREIRDEALEVISKYSPPLPCELEFFQGSRYFWELNHVLFHKTR